MSLPNGWLGEPGAFALVGMGAVFTEIVRAPVTSIIFEMTHNYSIILPLMVANITSYALATKLSPTPIYDALLLQDGIHLPHAERQSLKQMPVSLAMTTDVETLRGNMDVAEAFQYIQTLSENHRAYPVANDAGRLEGLVTMNDLKRALAGGRNDQMLEQVATHNVVHVHPDHTLATAIIKLGRQGISQLPVVSRKDSAKILGILTMHDMPKRSAKNRRPAKANLKCGRAPHNHSYRELSDRIRFRFLCLPLYRTSRPERDMLKMPCPAYLGVRALRDLSAGVVFAGSVATKARLR